LGYYLSGFQPFQSVCIGVHPWLMNGFNQFLQPPGPEGEVEILRVVVAVGEAGVCGEWRLYANRNLD
jgi:hypothetical protein